MLLKAALWADLISRGTVSLQPRLTSQTRLRRWISHGTVELQETSGAGSFQPVSLQWTGWYRQLLLGKGWLQSTNCVMLDRMAIMILFTGVKKKKKESKQSKCWILPEQKQRNVWNMSIMYFLKYSKGWETYVYFQTDHICQNWNCDTVIRQFIVASTAIVITISVTQEVPCLQFSYLSVLVTVSFFKACLLLNTKASDQSSAMHGPSALQYPLMCLSHHGKNIILQH